MHALLDSAIANRPNVMCLQYCAKVTQANFDKFPGFSWLFEKFPFKRNFCDFSTNFQGKQNKQTKQTTTIHYPFIPRELLNDNSQWMLTSQEISREGSLFWTVSREISEENLLWLLRVLIQTKQNTATVRDLLLC